ncbi:hypothetical protein CsSME_00053337 [Camellia sinensis var. sinensis]
MKSINVVVDDTSFPITSLHEKEDGDPQILDMAPQSQGEAQSKDQEGESTPMESPSPKSAQKDATTATQVTTNPMLKPSARVKLNHLIQ